MEKAYLRIVRDTPPPKIIAQATTDGLSRAAITVIPAPIPGRSGRRLDVDAVLARSLPKLDETLW